MHLTQPFANPEDREILARAWVESEAYRTDSTGSEALPASPARLPQRRLTDEEISEIVAGYEAGASQTELAERFAVHRTTVLYLLRREGVATRRKVRLLTGGRVDHAVDFYRSGLSLAKVGERLGVGANTVGRELIMAGVELRPRGRS